MSEMELEEAVHHTPEPQPLVTVPVHAEGQDLAGGHQGVHFTMVVSLTVNPVVQLLGRDYDRLECRVMTADEPVVLAQSKEIAESANNQAASAAAAGGVTSGSQTDPAAGTVITSQALPAGTYAVSWDVALNGSGFAAGDSNNFGLYLGATLLAQSLNGNFISGNFSYPQPPLTVTVPAGGATLAVKNIGAAGASTVIYQAQLGAAQTGTVTGPPNPTGSYLPVGLDRVLRNGDEVWVAATSSTPTRVSVIVSRRLPVARPTFA